MMSKPIVTWKTRVVRYLNEQGVNLARTDYDYLVEQISRYDRRQYWTVKDLNQIKFLVHARIPTLSDEHTEALLAIVLGYEDWVSAQKACIGDTLKRKPV